MTTKRDYYEVLGVARSASSDEIRSAYRRLARQYHPDVSQEQNAEAQFKEINEAYEVLSNAEKRTTYDRFGHAGTQSGPGASVAVSPTSARSSKTFLPAWAWAPELASHSVARGAAPTSEWASR